MKLRFIAAAVFALTVLSCAQPQTAKPEPVTNVVEGLAGVVAHTNSAERHVQNAVPHADSTGMVHLGAASDEHKEVLAGAAQARHALEATEQQIGALRAESQRQATDYAKLESRWFVRWGRSIERALWIIGVTWLALGVTSVALGVGNPLGWGVRAGKEIVRLIPLMNPFSWVRDWLIALRAPGPSSGQAAVA